MTIKRQWKKWVTAAVLCLLAVCLFGGVIALCVSTALCNHVSNRIKTIEELEPNSYDCILVLGCRVYSDGTPSPMLEDRCLSALEAFETGCAPVLLLSGDHRSDDYNEVQAMKQVALDEGISETVIFLDHAGLSTYESVARCREVFGAERVLIVTQKYHLFRALYLAEKLGMEADGLAADRQSYTKGVYRESREVLARIKDIYLGLVQPEVSDEAIKS